ncbi:APG6-domain-containing protein [Hesseltinella vesiculosa]|uniref:APG6-domain-containing protein n=1 Tax=Hesseltinella vesiculosa TaxID=101127 RepID=A0A1X2GNP6_9FUNG|nr:APG6-domain-containing protein [Hesseltinella vesiculosa]
MPRLACQKCNQPLKIDESLLDLDPSSTDLVLGPLTAEEQYMEAQSALYYNSPPSQEDDRHHDHAIATKQVLPPSQQPQTGPHQQPPHHQQGRHASVVSRTGYPVADSFVMLSKSQVPPATAATAAIHRQASSHMQRSGSSSSQGLASVPMAPSLSSASGAHQALQPSLASHPDPPPTGTSPAKDIANKRKSAGLAHAASSPSSFAHRRASSTAAPVTESSKISTSPSTRGASMDLVRTQPPPDPMLQSDISEQSRNNSLSHRLKVATRLFNIMSSKSSVDHPMCQECTDLMIEHLQRQLDDVNMERDCYLDFLKTIKQEQLPPSPSPAATSSLSTSPVSTHLTSPHLPHTMPSSPPSARWSPKSSSPTVAADDDVRQLQQQVDTLIAKEQQELGKLAVMNTEHQALQEEYEKLQKEAEALDAEEQLFWDECNQYQLRYQQFQNQRDTINMKYDHDVRQLERLQKTVVYNDAFCIVQDGPFGTINGYRLGRLHSHPVEWNEINAAWGQTLLLLYTVANKLNFQFKSYRLVPMGSSSKIEKVDGDVVVSYELYGSGDYGINRMLFLNRRFDHAMVAVLNCLKQLSDYAERKDRNIRLPYRINKDKIGELSIRLQFNQDELWTKALRYMLTNMKWILIFASRAGAAVDS